MKNHLWREHERYQVCECNKISDIHVLVTKIFRTSQGGRVKVTVMDSCPCGDLYTRLRNSRKVTSGRHTHLDIRM
jgi:hypothetical protein